MARPDRRKARPQPAAAKVQLTDLLDRMIAHCQKQIELHHGLTAEPPATEAVVVFALDGHVEGSTRRLNLAGSFGPVGTIVAARARGDLVAFPARELLAFLRNVQARLRVPAAE